MSRVVDVLRSPTLWLGLLLIFVYWPVAYRVPSDPQIEAEQIARVVFGMGVIIGYLPAVWRALLVRQPSWSAQLVLGIFLVAAGGVGNSAWILMWRFAGKPHWMLEANLNGFWLWLLVLGATLHQTAKRRKNEAGEHVRDLRIFYTSVMVTIAACTYALVFRPDVRAFVEWLKPWFDDGF